MLQKQPLKGIFCHCGSLGKKKSICVNNNLLAPEKNEQGK